MTVRIQLVPLGFKGYAFRDGRDIHNRTLEDTVFTLEPFNGTIGECFIGMATGPLDQETNIAIAEACVAVGYTKAWMAVPEGKPCSRLAAYKYTKDALDWYCADIKSVWSDSTE